MTQTEIFTWGHTHRYNDYSTYLRQKFAYRVQKISLDVGFSCPNRDGNIGRGGCTYCNNYTFNPNYGERGKSVKDQIDKGISFFAHRYAEQKYMAYFQAYTNTYGDVELLKELYANALSHPEVIGLVIATRPDCVDAQILEYLAQLSRNKYIVIEYGIETTCDNTLAAINRGHTFADSRRAIQLTADYGLHVGGHIILGLPGEDKATMLAHAAQLSALPVETLKLHHLQITKGTTMEKQYAENAGMFTLFSKDEYLSLVVEFLEHLSPNIVVERFLSESPRDMLIAPKWDGTKNFEFAELVKKELTRCNTWQGRLFSER